MAFFMPYHVRHTEAPLATFLRLAEDLSTFPNGSPSFSGPSNGCRRQSYRPQRAAPRPWNPRFEARETQEAYILRGELPGLNRDHVTIEFPEAQKIVVSGKVVEASQEEPTPAAVAPEQDSTATTATVDHADDSAAETESRSSYQATVEDADEDDGFEVVGESAKTQEKQPVESEAEPKAKKPEEQATGPAKERVIRQFSRTFTFDAPVEYDFVTASLKDGLLEVVIPKLKHQPHQVIVN